MNNINKKYLKYKKKYLDLKEELDGGLTLNRLNSWNSNVENKKEAECKAKCKKYLSSGIKFCVEYYKSCNEIKEELIEKIKNQLKSLKPENEIIYFKFINSREIILTLKNIYEYDNKYFLLFKEKSYNGYLLFVIYEDNKIEVTKITNLEKTQLNKIDEDGIFLVTLYKQPKTKINLMNKSIEYLSKFNEFIKIYKI